ncbi:MAG TPA: 2Fe-2S iron-sulfur cluster-binding protein, partial [Candidatus Limnocylindrales bacterium]|nr:2Fe-2S iron-sulfur cluster-binding protein [Candidatus Limnocylindrales bacterium]
MTDASRIVVDGRPLEFAPGDSVAISIVRGGEVPGRGGTLCLAGDCGNCLATVDGIAYVRTCQVTARPGTVVVRHPAEGKPPLPRLDGGDLTRSPKGAEIAVRRVETEVAVIGGGAAGQRAAAAARAAGREVLVLDAADAIEVMGLYPGPSVVAREPAGMLHVGAEEVVVATGSAEIQPVCPGSDLAGIVTARAAERLEAGGVDLGRVVRVGRELVR